MYSYGVLYLTEASPSCLRKQISPSGQQLWYAGDHTMLRFKYMRNFCLLTLGKVKTPRNQLWFLSPKKIYIYIISLSKPSTQKLWRDICTYTVKKILLSLIKISMYCTLHIYICRPPNWPKFLRSYVLYIHTVFTCTIILYIQHARDVFSSEQPFLNYI